MSDKDQNEDWPEFPEGYEHFAQMARETAGHLRILDEQISNIPKEDIKRTSYRLQFNPAGLAKAEEKLRNRLSKSALIEQKKQLEADLNKRVERDLEVWNPDPETAGQIRLATLETVYPNPFKGMSEEKFKEAKGMEKDLQHSQDYMRILLEKSKSSLSPPGSRNPSRGKEPDRS